MLFRATERRFPILKYVCRVKLANIPKIIVACVVLHNIAKHLNDRDFDEDEEEDPPEDINGPLNENNLPGVLAIRHAIKSVHQTRQSPREQVDHLLEIRRICLRVKANHYTFYVKELLFLLPFTQSICFYFYLFLLSKYFFYAYSPLYS